MHRFAIMIVCLAAPLMAVATQPASMPAAPKTYALVVSQATYTQPDWRAVVDALVARHDARVIRYDLDVNAATAELAAAMPDYICFVARPEEANREFVVNVHRLTRRLDSDPYTDALWGILTGYDAKDALKIAQHAQPLNISRGASGVGPGHIAAFKEGFASVESSKNDFWIRKNGQTVASKVAPDPAQALAEGFNTMAPEVFFTSGHATEKGWEMGFNFPSGRLRCKDGQLLTLNLDNKRFDINSPNPKVYLPMGNCLIGRIPARDCMATALMHTGGVYQMIGYTVVTWYGKMGWGTASLFSNGHFDLAEAFFFNNQAIMHSLRTEHAQYADVNLESYEMNTMDALFNKHFVQMKDGKPQMNQDAAGLVWDRDTVVFYGDPAWDARMPRQPMPWQECFTRDADGQITFTLTATADGTWPDKPVMAWLPDHFTDIKIVEGADLNPLVTDNFLLLPLKGKFTKGQQVRLAFKGTPMTRPNADALKKLAAIAPAVEALPAEYRAAASDALKLAGDNRDNLIAAISALKGEELEPLAFLLVNMPLPDLTTLSRDALVENVQLAVRAWHQAPWTKAVPKELFLNDVLPYANLDEARDPWRKDLMEKFAARAWKCDSPGQAAKLLNSLIYKELNVTYHATKRPRPNQSPAESIKASYASCTGLSVLLADACRACGIPARLAGIPSWKDGKGDANGNHGGNHTWVEIWADGKWNHLGASEGSELNNTWFTAKTQGDAVDPKAWEHCIYAASFKKTATPFPMVWAMDTRWVSALDVTQSYRALAPATQPATAPIAATAPATQPQNACITK